MRPIWKGAIQFGLVNIPVNLFPAVRREDLTFRLLRAKDLSPVNYKRVAAADGKTVEWADIVKGYEYEKGKFVVLKEEDFKRVDVEATQAISIQTFVKLAEVNPVFFHKPYFLEADKRGDHAYVLLRDALKDSGMIGIAKVVIRTREHLAALKPDGERLMLELMHFADELVDAEEFKAPVTKTAGKKELTMALALIESMAGPWHPEEYHDEYRERVEDLIEAKMKNGGKSAPVPAKKKSSGKVIDLVAVLQESLGQAKSGASAKKRAPAAKKAAAPKTKAPRKAG